MHVKEVHCFRKLPKTIFKFHSVTFLKRCLSPLLLSIISVKTITIRKLLFILIIISSCARVSRIKYPVGPAHIINFHLTTVDVFCRPNPRGLGRGGREISLSLSPPAPQMNILFHIFRWHRAYTPSHHPYDQRAGVFGVFALTAKT